MDKALQPNKSIEERATEARVKILAKGYLQLPLGSYYRWLHKKHLDQLLEKRVLIKNRIGQFVPNINTIFELKRFDDQYKKWQWEQEKSKQLKAQF